MALTSDLMGLGMPAALAALEGFTIPASVAGATTALATGTPLTGGINQVTTAGGQTAVVLSNNTPVGCCQIVYVSTATAALVFPPTSLQQINEVTAGNSFSVAQAKTTIFWRVSATKWIANLSA